MRKLALLFVFVVLASCSRNEILPDVEVEADASLKGVWKLVSVRYEGGRLPDANTLYAVVDPETFLVALFADGTEESGKMGPLMDMMNFVTEDGEIVLVRTHNFEDYRNCPDGEFVHSRIPYEIFNEDELHVYPEAAGLIEDDTVEPEPAVKALHMEFHRDTEIEEMVDSDTKVSLTDWMKNCVEKIVEVVWGGNKKIDEKSDFVKSNTWSNSQGWQPENWMSKLPDGMPVAWVNIPGSHDSSTTKDEMSFLADWTDAWVQTYSIEEQFNKGARYFDFRVGSELVPCYGGMAERTMKEEEREAVTELQMYHGPLCTNTPFIGTMRNLANKIMKDKTEFIVINVQAERESDGVGSAIFREILGFIKKSYKNDFFAAVNEQSMDIANRLLKKFSREYDDTIFIPYTSTLTVGEARGHIIIMESESNKDYQCHEYYVTQDGVMHDENWLRASFLHNWPDNKAGYATIYTYSMTGNENNMYVQSYYDMKTDDTDRISKKKETIRTLATSVSETNLDSNKANVWGFSAMNANTGSPTSLETYVFAHEFNGFAFEMYATNMTANKTPFRCGIVPMDHYGASIFDDEEDIKVYGDKLSWAVIESNFYQAQN